jgi:threonine dehydratase
MVALLAHDQVVAEASGAVGVAAVRAGLVAIEADGPIVAVVTGGNVDARVLARLLARHADASPA